MPAEWHPHAATWLAFPHNRETWPGRTASVERTFLQMIENLLPYERVSLLVAQVILETSGRCTDPMPDEPLFEKGYLESVDLVHLVLRLQSEFDVTLDASEAQPLTLRTIDAITELVAARTGS